LQRLWPASLLLLVKSRARQESCLSPKGEFSPDSRTLQQQARDVGAKSFPAQRRDQDKSVQATRDEGEIVTFKHHFDGFARTEIPTQ